MEQLELFPDCVCQLSLAILDLTHKSTGLTELQRSAMLQRQLHSVEVSAYNCRCPRCTQNRISPLDALQTGMTNSGLQQASDRSDWSSQLQNAYQLPPGTKPGQVVLLDQYDHLRWWEPRLDLYTLVVGSLLLVALAVAGWLILR